MFVCSSYTFLLVGREESFSPTQNGSPTCAFVSSPGRHRKQKAYNFMLLKVPCVFENNVCNISKASVGT